MELHKPINSQVALDSNKIRSYWDMDNRQEDMDTKQTPRNQEVMANMGIINIISNFR